MLASNHLVLDSYLLKKNLNPFYVADLGLYSENPVEDINRVGTTSFDIFSPGVISIKTAAI